LRQLVLNGSPLRVPAASLAHAEPRAMRSSAKMEEMQTRLTRFSKNVAKPSSLAVLLR